ncbi:hypothetical protein [Actinokineospora sp.]|uniref:hypothetical protein n=1 Tax=Actinokineospora sp. TaxID=1872133 RepID=UPI0040384BD7
MPTDPLARELRELGRELRESPPPPGLTAAVLARVAAEPIPVRASLPRRAARWFARRWRALVSVLTGLVLVAALTPPVRAAVAEWLGFGAVEVRTSTGVPPASAPPPPAAGGVDLDRARELVAFDVVVPAVLGAPSGVEVSADREVVSMTWTGQAATVRLDQVGGRLAPYFVKTLYDRVEFTSVHGEEALWLARPHEVRVLTPDGSERRADARLAGRTLIWQSRGVTLRLEGDFDRERAVAVAESAR